MMHQVAALAGIAECTTSWNSNPIKLDIVEREDSAEMTLISVSKLTRSHLTASRHHSALQLLSLPDLPHNNHKRCQNIMSDKSRIFSSLSKLREDPWRMKIGSLKWVIGAFYGKTCRYPVSSAPQSTGRWLNEVNKMLIGFLCCTDSQFPKTRLQFQLWLNLIKKFYSFPNLKAI